MARSHGSVNNIWKTTKRQHDLLTLTSQQVALKYKIGVGYARRLQAELIERGIKKVEELRQNQPDETELEKLERFRELLEDFKENGIPIGPEDADKIETIKFYQMGSTDSDGEPQVTTLRSVTLRNTAEIEAEEASFLSQAAPVNITPSDKKPADRDFTRIFVFSDTQIEYRRIQEEYVPIHDEDAMKIGRMICRDLQPDVIVNCGDTVDLPQLSRFEADSNHFQHNLQLAFDRAHQYYAELRADNPNAEIHEVDSNHNVRLGKFVLKNAMAFYGLKQSGQPPEAWPILTYPFLANLDALDVTWHGGYGAAEYQYSDDLIFIHGEKLRSNGSTAELLSRNYPYTSVVAGHGHKSQMHQRTQPDGKYLTHTQVGPLCKTTGEVPGYGTGVDDRGIPVPRQMDWQNQVLVIDDYGDGHYLYTHIPIMQGRAFHDGKEYRVE